MSKRDPTPPADVKTACRSASLVGRDRVVFNIGSVPFSEVSSFRARRVLVSHFNLLVAGSSDGRNRVTNCGVSSCVFCLPDYFERIMLMTAPDAIGSEVVAIDGENGLQIVVLRHDNEGGIGKVHRRVGILNHEFEGSPKPLIVKGKDTKTTIGNEVHETLRADARRLQQVKGLGQNWDSRGDRLLNCLQYGDASPVSAVGRIEQRNERTGVDQDHRPCFLLTISATAALACVAGARA